MQTLQEWKDTSSAEGRGKCHVSQWILCWTEVWGGFNSIVSVQSLYADFPWILSGTQHDFCSLSPSSFLAVWSSYYLRLMRCFFRLQGPNQIINSAPSIGSSTRNLDTAFNTSISSRQISTCSTLLVLPHSNCITQSIAMWTLCAIGLHYES